MERIEVEQEGEEEKEEDGTEEKGGEKARVGVGQFECTTSRSRSLCEHLAIGSVIEAKGTRPVIAKGSLEMGWISGGAHRYMSARCSSSREGVDALVLLKTEMASRLTP